MLMQQYIKVLLGFIKDIILEKFQGILQKKKKKNKKLFFYAPQNVTGFPVLDDS